MRFILCVPLVFALLATGCVIIGGGDSYHVGCLEICGDDEACVSSCRESCDDAGGGLAPADDAPPAPSRDPDADDDGDGLTNAEEEALGTDPDAADTDGDGLSDGEEVARGTDPLDPDTDGDGLSDGYEAGRGTDPLRPDTDGDGHSDGEEIACGSSPLDRWMTCPEADEASEADPADGADDEHVHGPNCPDDEEA